MNNNILHKILLPVVTMYLLVFSFPAFTKKRASYFLLIILSLSVALPAKGQFTDGTRDSTFITNIDYSAIFAMVEQNDGKVLVAGQKILGSGSNARDVGGVTRINEDGSTDTDFGLVFSASANQALRVSEVLEQADGKILIAGRFDEVEKTLPNGSVQTYPSNGLVRINTNGEIDAGFNPPAFTGSVVLLSITQQSNEQIIIGGTFTTAGSQIRNVARLDLDGSIDTAFNSNVGPNNTVINVVQQADGKILIAGDFSQVDNAAKYKIARFNNNGSLDTNFTAQIEAGDGSATDILMQGSKIIVGRGPMESGVFPKTKPIVQRLHSDGTLDSSFQLDNTIDSYVTSMALQSDGYLLIAGGKADSSNSIYNVMYRYNSDGVYDNSFAGPNSTSRNILPLSNGSLLMSLFSRITRFTTGLLVSQDERNQISLNWAALVGADSYRIDKCQRYTSSCWPSLFTNSNSYIDQDVIRGQEYSYRVYACDANQNNCQIYGRSEIGSANLEDEYEDDDTAQQAQLVSGSIAQVHSFDAIDDTDWLKFTLLNQQQSISLSTSAFNGSADDTIITLYDENLNQLAENNDIQAGVNRFSKIDITLPAGTYYLKVEQFIGQNTNPGPVLNYTLNIQLGLQVSQDKVGVIELDWEDDLNAGTYQVYRCLQANQTVCETFFTTESAYTDQAVRGKDYFYTIYACDINRSNCNEISDTVRGGLSYKDVYENNDTWQQAKLVKSSTIKTHSFHRADDPDWVKIQLTDRQKVSFSTESFEGSFDDTVMVLYDENLQEIAMNDDISPNINLFSKIEKTLNAGVYYLKIVQNSDLPSQLYKRVANYKLNVQLDGNVVNPMGPIIYLLLSED